MSEAVAESAATAETAESSMEKLQVCGEAEPNVSTEDILGGEKLLMSDSDGEDVTPFSKNGAPTRKNKQQQRDNSNENSNKEPIEIPETIEEEPTEKNENMISERTDTDITRKVKKISAIIDTDSEDEEEARDESHVEAETDDTPKKQTQHKRRTFRLESDESDNEQTTNHPQLKGLVDSDSESEHNESETAAVENEAASLVETKKGKPVRASAKKALNDMQAIQSEQQRLHREAHISVPYHQPKPRTLKEFLSRRTINRPLATARAGGSPMPNKQPRLSCGLRMNTEELEAYAKLMEERAKEAAEFFKSESESEEEEVYNANNSPNELKELKDDDEPATSACDQSENVADKQKQVEEAVNIEAASLDVGSLSMEENQESRDAVITTELLPIDDTELAATDDALKERSQTPTIPMDESNSPSKERLVTNVIDLPKLDLSTLNITVPSEPATPRISEAIRRLKIEKSNEVSPSLKDNSNMFIDLETGDVFEKPKERSGVDDLLQRLIKTRKPKKHKTTETVNILNAAHGKLELSKVNIHLHDEEPVYKEQKPGAAFVKMQEHLKSLIRQKRVERATKKYTKHEHCKTGMSDDEEFMEVDEEDEPDEEADEHIECDEEENEVTINDDEEIIDKESVEVDEPIADEVEDEKANEEADEDSEHEEQPKPDKPKNRIIRPIENGSSDEDDIDLLQTPKATSVPPLTATQLQLSAHKLFDDDVGCTASDEENELLGLCSGRFTQNEKPIENYSAIADDKALISQMPITQIRERANELTNELETLCSGSFPTQQDSQAMPPPSLPTRMNKIVSSDEEETLQTEKPRTKKLTKKKQKKKIKLGFSDDEESDNDDDKKKIENEQSDEEIAELENEAEDVPQTYVEYDSEENEIIVEMTKKDCRLRAANFVENEAELSESEWGSADEDEKNLDTYDIELGDDDEFDRDQLKSELEKIHARKMLDQDIREVRQIKEMLFEDEEGSVRQRKFRWKNAESGFGLEEQSENAGEANEGSGDEENEHLWRKIRYEREQLLLEKGLKEDTSATSLPLSPALLNVTSSAGGGARKLNIITAKKPIMEPKKNSPFLISKTVTTMQHNQKSVRGSFLVRDRETLCRLAGMTKGAVDTDGTAGTVAVKSAKGKNFVFATLTEEEHEHQKRKAADLLNSSNETGISFMKKPRLEKRQEKCLIDQLL